jgi:predicted ATPase with chaperone activity
MAPEAPTLRPAAPTLPKPSRTAAGLDEQAAGSQNPCPCGHLGDPRHACTCLSPAIERYRGRISGPLLDRIDLHVELPAISLAELRGGPGLSVRALDRILKVARTLADLEGSPAIRSAHLAEAIQYRVLDRRFLG